MEYGRLCELKFVGFRKSRLELGVQMRSSNFSWFLIKVFLACIPLSSNLAWGGSIAGEDITGLSTAFSGCDVRRVLVESANVSFCTKAVQASIRDQCYVVVHAGVGERRKASECSWQGCESISFVGAPAQLSSNQLSFIEYGIETPRNDAPFARIGTTNNVLPKSPYPRHYMTAGDALTALNACSSTTNKNPLNLPEEVRTAICRESTAAGREKLKMNPYWLCFSELKPSL
jgi:hypothetical protein